MTKDNLEKRMEELRELYSSAPTEQEHKEILMKLISDYINENADNSLAEIEEAVKSGDKEKLERALEKARKAIGKNLDALKLKSLINPSSRKEPTYFAARKSIPRIYKLVDSKDIDVSIECDTDLELTKEGYRVEFEGEFYRDKNLHKNWDQLRDKLVKTAKEAAKERNYDAVCVDEYNLEIPAELLKLKKEDSSEIRGTVKYEYGIKPIIAYFYNLKHKNQEQDS